MFEFIVSGQIPGTPIVITFQWVLALAGLFFGMSIARKFTRTHRQNNVANIQEFTL